MAVTITPSINQVAHFNPDADQTGTISVVNGYASRNRPGDGDFSKLYVYLDGTTTAN